MIVATVTDLDHLSSFRFTPLIKSLLEDLSPYTEIGVHEIADGIRALTSTYQTKTIGLYESHKEYVDIQTLVEGEEYIYVTDRKDLEIETHYDSSRDIAFYKSPQLDHRILLRPQTFALFFPHDAHMPQIAVESPATVKKIVFKIRVDILEK